jgi:hypothetical protein
MRRRSMIAVGIGTHKQRHIAVALDGLGQLLGELSIDANTAGYRELSRWAHSLHGEARKSCSGSRAPAAGAPGSASTCNTQDTPC